MKKWLIRGFGVVLAVTLVVTGIAGWIVASDSGARWLLQSLVPAIDDRVEINGVSGTLLSPLSIDSVSFNSCQLVARLDEVDLDWDPRQLLEKMTYVSHFSVAAVDLRMLNNCEQPDQETGTALVMPERIDLPVQVDIRAGAINRLTIEQDGTTHTIEDIRFKASALDGKLNMVLENLDYTTLNLAMGFDAELHQPYALNGDIRWSYGSPDQQDFAGEATLKGNMTSLEFVHTLSRPYRVDSRIHVIDLLENTSNPEISAINSWEEITFAVAPGRELVIRDGSLDANGPLDRLAIALEATVDSNEADNIRLSANALLTKTRAVLDPLTVRHEDMTLDATGSVEFAGPVKIKLDLAGQGLNPGILLPDYPGSLDVEAHLDYIQGPANDGQPASNQLDLKISTLSGQLREFPVHGSGHIFSDLDRVTLEDINLSVGDNQVKVDGEISQSIELVATIQAPTLNQVVDTVTGDLAGSMEISGSLENLAVNAVLESSKLGYLDNLQVFNTSISVLMESAGSQAIEATVDVERIIAAEQEFDAVSVHITGTRPDHSIEANAGSTYGSVSLQANGGYNPESAQWQGIIRKLALGDTMLGDWQATKEVTVVISAAQQKIENLCLSQIGQLLCLDYSSVESGPRTLQAKIENLDLGIGEQVVGEAIGITGTLDASAKLNAEADGDWKGKVEFATVGLALVPSDKNSINESLEIGSLAGSISLDRESSIQVSFESNRGRGSAELKIAALNDLESAEILGGNVKLDIPELEFLNPYISGAKIGDGSATIDLDIRGPLKTPDFTGTGQVDSLAISIPELGVEYKNTSVVITANDLSRIDIDGQLEAGDGKLEIDGSLEFDDTGGIQYRFDINGDDFPVMNTLTIQASVSPDLEISGSPGNININGKVLIPSINVVLQQLPAGIASVSKDEVIINSTDQAPLTESLNILGNIDVAIGESAHFNGFGLDADLAGELSIKLEEKKAPAGYGVLSMQNAIYSALGQTLQISKGNIIFSGPLDDPLLDVLIERSDNDTQVALMISGKADNPDTLLTSNPDMSDANKLSYLITGRKMNELGKGEGVNLAAAAITLGLSRNSSVIEELGTSLGFDTVTLGGDGGMESTSLLLGKHLSPNLYVSYAKDLFSDISAYQLNYQLTDNLSLEVESGRTQEVDLIYSIKR